MPWDILCWLHIVLICVVFVWQESEQNLLMSIIMDTYSRIFTRMQNESLDEATKDRLSHVQEHLKKLQDNYFPGKSAELKTYAETLWAIKVRWQFQILWNLTWHQVALNTKTLELYVAVVPLCWYKRVLLFFSHLPMVTEKFYWP